MGLVMICKYKRTKNPLYVEQAGLNLYSVEELAYFLYHNICLVDRKFFDERLCRWLCECGCAELADQIRKGVSSTASVENLMLAAVGFAGIFSVIEREDLSGRLKGLVKLQEQERLKLRADELLNNRNEWAAMEEYERILRMHQNSRLGMEFYSAVWNNLGVCYARQFLFKKAAECFETSCEYCSNEATKEQAELAWQLAEGILPGAGRNNAGDINPQKKLLQWEREYRVRAKF